jgi:Ca2+-binding RTX toxin-like protein
MPKARLVTDRGARRGLVGLVLIGLAALTLTGQTHAHGAPVEEKLLASDGSAGDRFGWSVAVDGNTAVIGTPVIGSTTGAVYVFERSGDSWTQSAKLTASDGEPGDQLGWSVAIDGDTIVAGAPRDNFSLGEQGSVYTFARSGPADRTETGKLVTADSDTSNGELLGISVAIDGDVIVAGALFEQVGSNLNQGAAYTFDTTGAATRSETAKLTSSDGAVNDTLGDSVGIDGDTIVVGAPGDRVGTNNTQGSVYTFDRTGTAARTETAKLTASDGASDNILGSSVAIDGDTIVAGAYGANSQQGAAYTFATTGAAARFETAKLSASDAQDADSLGESVDIDGDTIIAGAGTDRIDDPGSVYAFARTGSAARTETTKFTATDGANGDELGTAAAISGDAILAGARQDDIETNEDQGSASVFFTSVPPPPGSVEEEVTGGETVTTDPDGTGPTEETPVQTEIVVPDDTAGTITVNPEPAGSPPSGFSFFDHQVDLSGPPAPSAAEPYVVTFALDESLLGSTSPGDVQVFRDGVPVADCTAQSDAVPDPCVADRGAGDDGDVLVTVRTTQFSDWNFGLDLAPDCTIGDPGSTRAQQLRGTTGADVICGGAGRDTIHGYGGDDVILAGGGNDRVNGGEGADTVDGGLGADRIVGGNGNDTLSGGDGNDDVKGGNGNDELAGGAGNDVIGGDGGNDTLSGAAGKDTLSGGSGNDTLSGGADNDKLFGSGGADQLSGDAGTDSLNGGFNNDECDDDGVDKLASCETTN